MNWRKKIKETTKQNALIASVWNRKKTQDSSAPSVTMLLPDEPFWSDIAQTNLNTWSVLLFLCRIAPGGIGIDKKKKNKINKTPLLSVWHIVKRSAAAFCSCYSKPYACTWNASGFGHVFMPVSATDVTRVGSPEPCCNTCGPWQMSVR